MKLSTAFLMLAPAAAFTPGANFNRDVSPLSMATEAATETKVRHYHYSVGDNHYLLNRSAGRKTV
jgi:hypothetical protein